MAKGMLILSFCLSFLSVRAQTSPSPTEFLGYTIGSRFTSADKIAAYFKKIGETAPANVKIGQYGQTPEGRPLLLAFIGSSENMVRLEAIRQNNLQMAGVLRPDLATTSPAPPQSLPPQSSPPQSLPSQSTPSSPQSTSSLSQSPPSSPQSPSLDNPPVIVWLSYNVHGDEASASEAAMSTLYSLVSDSRCAEWLKTTLVIINPCINPDGHDRYVNWFQSAVGIAPSPDPQSIEHTEPWPGGRTNHYGFDLNRDWVWQTQPETRALLEKYNEWLPQVHADFHEHDYNLPYYFAPAAEPYHEVVTPWQKQFQTLIGRNNAKYFDRQGWRYFTKEIYDLFYPGYGDTYPTYNGAIGMTYEQGGGMEAGLAVLTHDGDTLTLAERIEHHLTTSLSTIETCSQNAPGLIAAFKKYFRDAASGPGAGTKAYYIRTDRYGDRLGKLKTLLYNNGIGYVAVDKGSFSGLNFQTGQMTEFTAAAGDIVINLNQPKSNLVKVLFERNTRLSDSATYDITAWSLPFVFGLQAFSLNSYFVRHSQGSGGGASYPGSIEQGFPDSAYACLVRWTGVQSARFLSEMLKMGIRVRYSEGAFQSGGQEYGKGTLIITHPGNGSDRQKFKADFKTAVARSGVRISSVGSGFVDKGFDLGSSHIHLVTKPRVALLAGEGVDAGNAGEIRYFFEQELSYPVTLLSNTGSGSPNLKNYDVLILPDGQFPFLSDKKESDKLRDWISDGGRLIVLKNTITQLSETGWSAVHPQKEQGNGNGGSGNGDDENGKVENGKEKGGRAKNSRKGKNNRNGENSREGKNSVEKGVQTGNYRDLRRFETRDRDAIVKNVPGSIYQVELDNSHPLAFGYPDNYYSLKQDDSRFGFIGEGGWNVGVIKKNGYISGFTGSKAKEKLMDALVFGVQDLGTGHIVYLADDPLFRGFWENGKLLFCNAVFLVGQ